MNSRIDHRRTRPSVRRSPCPRNGNAAAAVSKPERELVVGVVIESRPGVVGAAQVLWQGFPQGINTTPTDVELTGETKTLAIPLPDLSQQAPGTKLEGIKLVIQWKPSREGNKATYVSPPIALPALNFP